MAAVEVVLEPAVGAVEGSIVADRAAGDVGAGDVGAGNEETGGELGGGDDECGGSVGQGPCMFGSVVDDEGLGDPAVGSGEERGEMVERPDGSAADEVDANTFV